jgi:predicted enzyme related to lactoylglutathione lyase
MLRKDTAQYAALTYYVNDIDKLVTELEATGISFSVKPTPQEMVRRYVISAPGGMKVSLVAVPMEFTQPPGPTMLRMRQEDYMKPEKYVNKVCGMFGEYACPVDDLTSAIEFWSKLGFVAVSKFNSPYPWAIVSDGLSVVGLHQTKHFTTPAITYFAADMKEKIEKLKASGLKNFSEMGGPANIAITTPENQKVFLFKMGM